MGILFDRRQIHTLVAGVELRCSNEEESQIRAVTNTAILTLKGRARTEGEAEDGEHCPSKDSQGLNRRMGAKVRTLSNLNIYFDSCWADWNRPCLLDDYRTCPSSWRECAKSSLKIARFLNFGMDTTCWSKSSVQAYAGVMYCSPFPFKPPIPWNNDLTVTLRLHASRSTTGLTVASGTLCSPRPWYSAMNPAAP
jgi:hypothetical protein